MDNDRPTERFRDIAETVVLSSLDPRPIKFKREHHLGARSVVAAILNVDRRGAVTLPSPVNRNAFLLGCQDYTDERTEEHLIVGYGYRDASTTKIDRVHHVVGNLDSVPIPSEIEKAIQDHGEAHYENEVILFHNHPRWWANLFFDNPPLASPADRNVLARMALSPSQLLRTLVGGGRVLFFLGENRQVKEIRLPRILPLLTAAKFIEQ